MTQTVFLGDLLTDLAMGPFGSNLKVDNFIDSGVPIIKGGNLYGHEVSGDFSFVSEEKARSLKRSLAYPDDIVITHRGTLGQVSIVPHGKYPYYLASQSQLRMTPDKALVNPRYLLYYLRSPIGQHELMQHAAQVGVPSIATPTKAVKSLKILLPKLSTQKQIADILGTIDEKIELNRKMNETLEQMGQALFRHYFIESPESGQWEVGKFSDFADHLKSQVNPAKFPKKLFSQYSIPGYDSSFTPEKSTGEEIMSSKYEVVYDSILISKLNPATPRVWAVLKPQQNAVCSTEFQVMKPKHNFAFCYFLLTSRELTNQMAMSASGTSNSHRRVKPSDILDFTFVKPSKTMLEMFEIKARHMLETIDINREQIQTLTTLRDTLLPRLISGKMKV